jgi:hypothetical protein
MIVKRLCWFAIFITISTSIHAQLGTMGSGFSFREQFKHAAGLGAVMYTSRESTDFIPAINYSPNISLTRNLSDFSVTIGSHLVLGYHPSGDSLDKEFIYTDLPILVELNFGHNASKDFYYDLGWFLGGGYSFNLVNENWQSGPVATVGFRTFIFGPSFTFRYLRFFAVDDDDISTHGLSISLNIGRYFEQVKKNNKISRFNNTR